MSRPSRTLPPQLPQPEVKRFYQHVADWEQQHFEALKKLYDSVREDFFASGNFAPF